MKSPVKQKPSTLQTIINNAQTGGGGGGTVDAYTKAESDAKFETKTDASSTYLSKSTAQSTYLAIADAKLVPEPESTEDNYVLTADYGETPSYSWQPASGGGTSDYSDLDNKPSINSVTLSGNKTTSDLNINDVPEVTFEDNNCVLFAQYDGQDGWYAWQVPDQVMNTVPSVNSAANGKVLTATYSGGTGSYAWAAVPTPSVDGIPPVTSSDGGKVLTATYSGGTGSYAWAAVPTPSVDGVPLVTSSDDGKVLTATYSGGTGNYEWATAPLQKFISQIDSSDRYYSLGQSLQMQNLYGFAKYIIYSLNSTGGISGQGEIYEGYMNISSPLFSRTELYESPYNIVASPSTFSISSNIVSFTGTDETVIIVEIPININMGGPV